MATTWPANCGKCSAAFDILAANHLSLCTACQKQYVDCAFCDVNYARIADGVCDGCTAPPPPSSELDDAERPNRDHYMHCKLCTRHFPPNKNNNGINCTRCCNKEATEGNDLFASRNLPASTKAAELLNKARARQPQVLSDAAATRAILNYQGAGYPRLGGNLPDSPKAADLPKKAGARQQQPAQQSTLSDAAATRAIINYQCAGYPKLGGM